MLNKNADATQGGIGSSLLIAQLRVGVLLTLARLLRRDGNLVVLKNSADSTSLHNLRLGRDWAERCCRSCPPTISARLSATPKTGARAHGAVDTPIACHQVPVVAQGLPHSRPRRDGRGRGRRLD